MNKIILNINNTDTSFNTIQDAINAGDSINGSTVFVKEGNYYEDLYLRDKINLYLYPGVVLYGQHSDNGSLANVQISGNGVLKTWATNTIINKINRNSVINIICNQFSGSISATNASNISIIAGNNFGNSKSLTSSPNSVNIGQGNSITGDYDLFCSLSGTINGSYSQNFGYLNLNLDDNTFTQGFGCSATKQFASAFNHQTLASAFASFATGDNTRALSAYSAAFGASTIVAANYGFGIGLGCVVGGAGGFAGGDSSSAMKYRSFAYGSYVCASANDAYIFGSNGINNNANSFALACLFTSLSAISQAQTYTNTDYTILKSDYIIIADDSFSPMRIILPDPSNIVNGQVFVVKEVGVVGITVDSGHYIIDGAYNYTMNTQWSILKVIWNSSANQWYTIQ